MEWWLRRTHALCRMTSCGGCRLVAVDFAICAPPGIPAWWLQAGGRWLLCVGGPPRAPSLPRLGMRSGPRNHHLHTSDPASTLLHQVDQG